MSDKRYYVKSELEQSSTFHLESFVCFENIGRPRDYILYFPMSSSFRPSRYLRSSSLVTRSALAASLEVFSTPSSTKIGQSTRSANANASDGRESMLITSPPRSNQMTA